MFLQTTMPCVGLTMLLSSSLLLVLQTHAGELEAGSTAGLWAGGWAESPTSKDPLPAAEQRLPGGPLDPDDFSLKHMCTLSSQR